MRLLDVDIPVERRNNGEIDAARVVCKDRWIFLFQLHGIPSIVLVPCFWWRSSEDGSSWEESVAEELELYLRLADYNEECVLFADEALKSLAQFCSVDS